MPLCNFKLILIVSESNNYLLDTERDVFIKLTQDGHPELSGVQIGAFTLPIIHEKATDKASVTKSALLADDEEEEEEDDKISLNEAGDKEEGNDKDSGVV